MKLFRFIALVGLAALEVLAAPPFHNRDSGSKRSIPKTHIRHEKRSEVQASSWTKVKRAIPGAILPMRVGLKQQNLQSGHNLLMDMCVNSLTQHLPTA